MSGSIVQIFKFILMGSLAALVHGVMLYICVSLYSIVPIWANVIAFAIAFIVSFLGHSWVTFRHNISHDNPLAKIKRLARWLTTSLLGFALNQGLFIIGLAWFGAIHYLLIWFVVTVMVTISSFFLGKLWAFKS